MSKKFGLGKGLGALIPDMSEDDASNKSIKDEEHKDNKEKDSSETIIPLNRIKANNDQPRKYFDGEKIGELAESIKNHGIIQPLILKKDGDFYTIIAGERRWRAAKYLGLKEVPAIIKELNDKEVLEISLIENIQRQDLNPIEEAQAYNKLLKDFNLTQEQLSERLSKSRTSITNTMRLLNLDPRVQQYIIEGVLSEGHGRALLSLKDKELQFNLAQKIVDENLSVRECEKEVKKVLETKDNKKDKEQNKATDNIYYKEIQNKLQNYFGTKVNINSKKDKGKIEIEYYSEDDLQRILDIINYK
ncbi:ParB/RepB/Spo0J family partition protein [Clostridium fallax]|uniref:Chromosome partitioning protein, ParB family n=1 Tax=Clostridium fallax TaxID=1533 RepID=A0A1M4X2R9_9CLOT|nr:ParB/RepB/Spo0J family partition protein [Clostridium fallax]SHE87687.1 chromosome partitioning protein, ParB family [Clostridium fallax]SQB22536.1 parB-like partition protein [Clostridium fallax]